jgi:hypothetical protein
MYGLNRLEQKKPINWNNLFSYNIKVVCDMLFRFTQLV